MAIEPDEIIRADDFINESERDATPANDEGKVVKLESNGRFSKDFIPGTPLAVYDLETSGTWEKPDFGGNAIIFAWGAGGGGAAAFRTSVQTTRVTGGTGGLFVVYLIPLVLLPSSVSYIIGEGGDGGTLSASGNENGDKGGNTSFGDYFSVEGGEGGEGGVTNVTGNNNVSSDFGYTPIQLVQGGVTGNVSTSSGTTAQNAPNQLFAGAGAGGAQNTQTAGTGGFSFASGGENLILNTFGGDGAIGASGNIIAFDGQATCGGGGAASITASSATGGKGGDGYIRIYII